MDHGERNINKKTDRESIKRRFSSVHPPHPPRLDPCTAPAVVSLLMMLLLFLLPLQKRIGPPTTSSATSPASRPKGKDDDVESSEDKELRVIRKDELYQQSPGIIVSSFDFPLPSMRWSSNEMEAVQEVAVWCEEKFIAAIVSSSVSRAINKKQHHKETIARNVNGGAGGRRSGRCRRLE